MAKATLALEDGHIFQGKAFGARASVDGEMVFNTGMTGYQEVLTDPSYRGQIVAMTYPHIGNYGINSEDAESDSPHVRGFVVADLCEAPSNWRSEQSLSDYLESHGIPGITGIDTRALTKILRVEGAMKAFLSTESCNAQEAVERARRSSGMVGMDYVKEVSTPEAYPWDPNDELSAPWRLVQGSEEVAKSSLPEKRYSIVAYDLGIKRNILRNLRQRGFAVTVVPAHTSAKEVLAQNPDGVFLSNGPGDPAALEGVHREIAQLIGKVPIFGICLGHQMLGHALGGKTFKLKFGHRGANQPVQELATGKVAITSQNHGFAVDAESLPSTVEVTHINLNDGTVEGLRHREHPVFSVQYHPEAAPGPHDASGLFDDFIELIEQHQG